uniref:hypothetical protein n=1 Tax=Hydrocytium acuminatum TaxID=1745963 RepID=UPI002A83ECFF|nr:hypothetical protein UYM18_pgp047 [Hydrocytium acuminatum]WOR09570.1 hypothetical protein [Hydrocytium acuminatum]
MEKKSNLFFENKTVIKVFVLGTFILLILILYWINFETINRFFVEISTTKIENQSFSSDENKLIKNKNFQNVTSSHKNSLNQVQVILIYIGCGFAFLSGVFNFLTN